MPELPDFENATFEDNEESPTRTRKPRSDKGKPRGPRGSGGSRGPRAGTQKKIVDDLLVPYATLSAGLALTAPTAAGVLMARGEKTVEAVVSLAAGNPRMLAALQKAAKVGPATEILQTLLMVGVAGAMDFGRIPPDNPLAAVMGISEIYAQRHPETPMPPQGMAPDGMMFGANGHPTGYAETPPMPANFAGMPPFMFNETPVPE